LNEREEADAVNDAIAALVRRHDPDRFLTSLFAPPDRRDVLLILYAFNHELARASEVASEPTLALIRLQWWREVVEGTAKRHEVATPLRGAIAAGDLMADRLLPLIEARETEAYADFEATADWRAWLEAGAGGLAVAAATALRARQPERLRPYGAAFGAAGLLRSTAALARQGRCLLPLELLTTEGLTREAFLADPTSEAAARALDRVRCVGQAFLAAGESVERPAIAAALPAVLARRDLQRWPRVSLERGLADRLAVTWAGGVGRVR
jgi:15-cis-phytoene synthase